MTFTSLADGARQIVAVSDTALKAQLAHAVARAWFAKRLTRYEGRASFVMPDRPGRPTQPELRHPRDMPKRSLGGEKGRIAFIHSIAHIELNAVDMTWDLIGRFIDQDMPRSYFDDWVRVGLEEAKHFSLLDRRLKDLGSFYGALPAHDGFWEAAQETGESHLARVAIVPLVLEARGLDVTPAMITRAQSVNDAETAEILGIIYRDEKRHVSIGMRWFRFLCDRHSLRPEPTFQRLVQLHFRSPLKPPFNDRARSAAGLTPGFYRPLAERIA